ncbi:uncharacterized protein LOC128225174 isoform X2 [Mya arenaria]|uniref:uncharacterized protein LOC128225174 isoform X2 n=1 Tax=Mya arenaria TaxID=6604 RepID=UPI0022E28165|nr:uncharacterized protein LOC128225174 isoform X2 [Mya arenaria]
MVSVCIISADDGRNITAKLKKSFSFCDVKEIPVGYADTVNVKEIRVFVLTPITVQRLISGGRSYINRLFQEPANALIYFCCDSSKTKEFGSLCEREVEGWKDVSKFSSSVSKDLLKLEYEVKSLCVDEEEHGHHHVNRFLLNPKNIVMSTNEEVHIVLLDEEKDGHRFGKVKVITDGGEIMARRIADNVWGFSPCDLPIGDLQLSVTCDGSHIGSDNLKVQSACAAGSEVLRAALTVRPVETLAELFDIHSKDLDDALARMEWSQIVSRILDIDLLALCTNYRLERFREKIRHKSTARPDNLVFDTPDYPSSPEETQLASPLSRKAPDRSSRLPSTHSCPANILENTIARAETSSSWSSSQKRLSLDSGKGGSTGSEYPNSSVNTSGASGKHRSHSGHFKRQPEVGYSTIDDRTGHRIVRANTDSMLGKQSPGSSRQKQRFSHLQQPQIPLTSSVRKHDYDEPWETECPLGAMVTEAKETGGLPGALQRNDSKRAGICLQKNSEGKPENSSVDHEGTRC